MQKKGFSLIEMIIAVAIIAILAGMGLYNSSGYMTSSKITKAKSEVSTLELAINQYNNDVSMGTISGTKMTSSINVNTLITNGYLDKTPEAIEGCGNYTLQTVGNGSKNKHVFLTCNWNNKSYTISIFK